jgi:hypothetical protein
MNNVALTRMKLDSPWTTALAVYFVRSVTQEGVDPAER